MFVQYKSHYVYGDSSENPELSTVWKALMKIIMWHTDGKHQHMKTWRHTNWLSTVLEWCHKGEWAQAPIASGIHLRGATFNLPVKHEDDQEFLTWQNSRSHAFCRFSGWKRKDTDSVLLYSDVSVFHHECWGPCLDHHKGMSLSNSTLTKSITASQWN